MNAIFWGDENYYWKRLIFHNAPDAWETKLWMDYRESDFRDGRRHETGPGDEQRDYLCEDRYVNYQYHPNGHYSK